MSTCGLGTSPEWGGVRRQTVGGHLIVWKASLQAVPTWVRCEVSLQQYLPTLMTQITQQCPQLTPVPSSQSCSMQVCSLKVT